MALITLIWLGKFGRKSGSRRIRSMEKPRRPAARTALVSAPESESEDVDEVEAFSKQLEVDEEDVDRRVQTSTLLSESGASEIFSMEGSTEAGHIE